MDHPSSWQEIRDKFLQGAMEYADLTAHWDSRQDLWTLRHAPPGEVSTPAAADSERFFKETARLALTRLGPSNDVRPSWHVWLDLMRKEKRGFKRIAQLRSWRGGQSIDQFLDEGTVPSNALITESGAIAHVFKESAEFCEDRAARVSADRPSHPAHTVSRWDEVEIRFLSDERVQITTVGATETRNFAEFGFADGRSGKPNLAWITLKSLAVGDGVFQQPNTGQGWPKVEKRMQEIRSRLREYFNLDDDPLPYVERVGYRARFRIHCAPSFKT